MRTLRVRVVSAGPKTAHGRRESLKVRVIGAVKKK
jgi:hypothetical protein